MLKVFCLDQVAEGMGKEPMILQPYVGASKEYGINILRVGDRVKIYGLTEIDMRTVRRNGTQCVHELDAEKYGPERLEAHRHADVARRQNWPVCNPIS